MAKWSDLVDCQELSRSENWADPLEGSTVQVVLQCAWTDSHSLVKELIGDVKPYVDNSSAPIPLFAASASNQALADDIKFTTDGDNQVKIPTHAQVTITYKRKAAGGVPTGTITHPDTNEVLEISETIEPVTRFFTLNSNYFSKSERAVEPLNPDEAPAVLRRELRFIRTIRGLASLIGGVGQSYLDLVNTVNEAKFKSTLIPGLEFESETLLFEPNPIVQETTIESGGTTSSKLSVTLSAHYNPDGWNKTLMDAEIDPASGDVIPKFRQIYDMRQPDRTTSLTAFLPWRNYVVADWKYYYF